MTSTGVRFRMSAATASAPAATNSLSEGASAETGAVEKLSGVEWNEGGGHKSCCVPWVIDRGN